MTALVFVDTNILLYAVDTRDRLKHDSARDWMAQLWRTRSGRTSAQVLNEFFVNATRRLEPGLTPEQAWQQVTALRSWSPQPMDMPTIELGFNLHTRYRLSWWDSLIVAAANLQGCSLLLTEDLQPEAIYAGVTVCNPFASRVQDVQARYASTVDIPLPRRRGRPRTRPATG
jgi:predicted nucleic acid-binding protein